VKSLPHLARNAATAVRDPEILQKWIQYHWAVRSGREPTLHIGRGLFRGFPHFNAYLGAWKYRPIDSDILFLTHSLRTARTVLDVGANFGVLTVLIGQLAPDAEVYAFEPQPRTFAALKRNVHSNGLSDRVSCIQSAVGVSIGRIPFLDTGAPATNRIAPKSDCTFDVELTTIDAFRRQHEIAAIDFLKIDVEGAELDVLSGATASFESGLIRRGMIEICPGNLKQFGKGVVDLRAFFEAHGYDLWWYGPDGRVISVVSADLPEDFLGNAAFMPKQLDRAK
jgi:FkbM family methyltransferase